MYLLNPPINPIVSVLMASFHWVELLFLISYHAHTGAFHTCVICSFAFLMRLLAQICNSLYIARLDM
jgi:hypothetical protein